MPANAKPADEGGLVASGRRGGRGLFYSFTFVTAILLRNASLTWNRLIASSRRQQECKNYSTSRPE